MAQKEDLLWSFFYTIKQVKQNETRFNLTKCFLVDLKIKSVPKIVTARLRCVAAMSSSWLLTVVNTTPISCGEDIKNMLFSDVATHRGSEGRAEKMD